MKKFKTVFLIMAMSICCFGINYPLTAYAEESVNNYVTTNGLGYAVNVATATNPLNINLGAPILDESYLQNMTFNRINRNNYQEERVYGYDLSSISSYYKQALNTQINADIFLASASAEINSTLSLNYRNYQNQFFAKYEGKKILYEEAIPNYSIFVYTYEDYFSSAFLYNLSLLQGDDVTEQDYYNFFNIFGTHMVASIQIGAKVSANYAIATNEIDFTTEVKDEIIAQIGLNFDSFGSIGGSASFEIQEGSSLNSQQLNYNTKIVVNGGDIQYINSIQNDQLIAFNDWQNSVTESNAVTIGYSQGGLLALWDILPSQYATLAEPMEEYFYSYLNDANVQYKEPFEYNGVEEYYSINSIGAEYGLRPYTEYRINDSGRFDNLYDVVNFKEITGLYVENIKKDDIKVIKIILDIKIKEVNDGYQYVFLYDGISSNANQLCPGVQIEHSPGEANANYKDFSMEFNIDINDIIDNKIIIRYGASGKNDDDWINTELYLRFAFYDYYPV